MSEIEAVWLKLAADAPLMAKLGVDDDNVPYLFQDELILTEEYLENSGKCAVVIADAGEWDAPAEGNRVRFPRLEIDIWSDPDRQADGTPVSTVSAKNKSEAILADLDRILHRTAPFDERWGDVRVLGSVRQIRSRARQNVDEGNGLMLTTIYVGLTAQ